MVQKFVQPSYGSQSGSVYPTGLDAAIAVLAEQAAQFAVNAQDTPNLTVAMRAGRLYLADRTIVSVASQNSAALTAPAVNPRKDIVYYDATTGAIGVATGVEAASPVDPAIPANKVPKARINWTVGMASITNSVIDDLSPHAQSVDYLLQRTNTWGANQTLQASLLSTKAAAPGFVRVTPNFCALDGSIVSPSTFSTSAACLLTNAVTGLSDAKAVLARSTIKIVSANAVGQRFSQTSFYPPSDSTCALISIAVHRADGYEFVALTAGTLMYAFDASFILPCTSSGQVRVKRITGPDLNVAILGYFD